MKYRPKRAKRSFKKPASDNFKSPSENKGHQHKALSAKSLFIISVYGPPRWTIITTLHKSNLTTLCLV